jgi:ribosomal-protein-alanine N-acetyltransferase
MSEFLQSAEVLLRSLSSEDIQQVHSIEVSVYDDPWTESLLHESLLAPMTHTLGIFLGEECLGYAVYQVIFSEGHLLNLAIAKDVQGRGLGTYLLKEMLRSASQLGAESIFLEVRPSNLVGRKLYERFGFRILLTRDRYYSNGEAAMVMLLDKLSDSF